MRLRVGILLPVLIVAMAAVASARVWTDKRGNTISAKFVRLHDGNVVLMRGNNILEFPLDDFSEKDQQFVEKEISRKGLRRWINTEGEEIVAKFSRVEGELVIVRQEGKNIPIPFAELSQKNQNFVREQLKAKGQEDLLPKQVKRPSRSAVAPPAASKAQNSRGEMRTWTDVRSRKIKARMLRTEGDKVVLWHQGKEASVPLRKLSPADQAYVRAQVARSQPPKPSSRSDSLAASPPTSRGPSRPSRSARPSRTRRPRSSPYSDPGRLSQRSPRYEPRSRSPRSQTRPGRDKDPWEDMGRESDEWSARMRREADERMARARKSQRSRRSASGPWSSSGAPRSPGNSPPKLSPSVRAASVAGALIVPVIVIFVASLIGGAIVLLACGIYNSLAGAASVPTPSFGKAIVIALIVAGANGAINAAAERATGSGEVTGATDSGSAELSALLISVPVLLLVMTALLARMLPTTTLRAFVVALIWTGIGIAIVFLFVFLLALLAAGVALR